MPTFLIIDDDDAVRESLAETIAGEGYAVEEAASGKQGLSALANMRIDGIFLDLRMRGIDGLEVLKRLRSIAEAPPVVVLTAHATAENTIEAMRLGAFDHLTKPISRADVLALAQKMTQPRPAKAEAKISVFGGMVGVSAAIRGVQKLIGRVADGITTVLITGETGTGKEVVAQAIHRFGDRASKPFVALNCAAIPAELLESELFGHVKGAFTGAVSDRPGAFATADGGILFLDEIGDMAPAMQAKMLRTLQDRVITPVGGKSREADVRIIAATHRDLGLRVKDGLFREDLLYRLNVLSIHIPPLRERPDDILPLAAHFLRESRYPGKSLSADAQDFLLRHEWPGNVRQLKNAIERAAVLAPAQFIDAASLEFLNADTLQEPKGKVPDSSENLPGAIEQLELSMIDRALKVSKGNRAEAARLLNIPRQQLYVKLKKYGL